MPRNADARPLLTLGVVAHSRKENERRLPIHPMHFERIDADLREHFYLENGYGESFGVADEQLAPYVGRGRRPGTGCSANATSSCCRSRTPSDLAEMREGQMLWGWPHCVQDAEVTQLAIDRRLTADRVRGDEPLGRATVASGCTSFTRTTNSPATARCCTRSS